MGELSDRDKAVSGALAAARRALSDFSHEGCACVICNEHVKLTATALIAIKSVPAPAAPRLFALAQVVAHGERVREACAVQAETLAFPHECQTGLHMYCDGKRDSASAIRSLPLPQPERE